MPIGIGIALSGILGAGASIFGAGAQVSAEEQAIAAQQQMYQQGLATQKGYVGQASSALSPYISAGQPALGWYNYLTGAGTSPTGTVASTVTGPNGQPTAINAGGTTSYNPLTAPLTAPFTAATLASTPGYQFTLGQGLKSTQNSYAAQGLGSSGAAEKGAASYATGLAQNTYNQQLTNYLTQNQQIANMLLSSGTLGENAAGTLSSIYGSAGNAALGGATTTGAGIASSTAGIGNALAGGAAGVANSASSAINSSLQYSLLQQLLANQSGGATGADVNAYNANMNDFQAFLADNPLTGSGAGYGGGPYAGIYGANG